MTKVYNGKFLPDFSVLMFQEIIALAWDYIKLGNKQQKQQKNKSEIEVLDLYLINH